MKLKIIGIILALSLLVSCSPKYENTSDSISSSPSNSPVSTDIIAQQSTQVPTVTPSIQSTSTPNKNTTSTKATSTKTPIKNNNTSNTTTEKKEVTVYITKTGEKFHRDGCRYLSKSKIPISLSNAIQQGYSPCSVCNPPTSSNSVSVPNTKEAEIKDNSSTSTEDKKEVTVYVTKTGEKYHSAGCSYLRKSCIPMSLSAAKSSGYAPCSRCHPPQ